MPISGGRVRGWLVSSPEDKVDGCSGRVSGRGGRVGGYTYRGR